MSAKSIAVSSDDVTYHVLPGSSGDLNFEGASASDTTFGASFSSSQPTLVSWSASANAYYKGFAGYVANFKKSGTSTAVEGEAMSVVSGKTYKINDSNKNVWDRTATIKVYDGVTDVTDKVESVDHLFGQITFLASYTVVGDVTVDVKYLPMSSVGTARDFSLTMNAESVDTTDFATAQANGGYNTFIPGLKTVSLDASGFYSATNAFKDLVTARNEMIVEINPDGSNKSVARGFFKAITTGQSGDVGGNEDETITFELSVPQPSSTVTANVVTPFKWVHDATTTLSQAVQVVLNGWQNSSKIYVKYLSDGVAGYKGEAVVTDCSMSSAVDGVAEFSISLQGSGTPSAV